MDRSQKIKTVVYLSLFGLVLGFAYFSTFKILEYWPIRLNWYYARIVACVAGSFLSLKLIHLLAVKANVSERKKGIRLLVFSLAFLFFLLETIFSFIPRSHGGAITLASRVWFQKYWHKNESGYRDREVNTRAAKAKFKIMVLGDSFVAGHGVKDPADRWADQLATHLPEGFEVFNLGVNGSNTLSQYDSLTHYPIQPDLLIFSHIPNDIEYQLFEDFILPRIKPQTPSPAAVIPGIGEHSFLMDFFYQKFKGVFNFGSIMNVEDIQADTKRGHLQVFLEPASLTYHLTRIGRILDYGKEQDFPVVMVLWPETNDTQIDVSAEIVNAPIAAYCRSRNVPVYDTYPVLKTIPFKQRVVSPLDVHPSVESQHQVGAGVYEFLVNEKLIPLN